MGTTEAFAPPLRQGRLAVLTGVLLAGACLLTDLAGALLLAPAAVGLLAVGLRDLRLRPVLALDDTGITVVDGWRLRQAPYDDVVRARVVTDRRTPLLELDLGDAVVVLTGRRLGTTPDEACARLQERLGQR